MDAKLFDNVLCERSHRFVRVADYTRSMAAGYNANAIRKITSGGEGRSELISPRCERFSDRVRSLDLRRGTLGRIAGSDAVAVVLKRTAVGGATAGQKHGQPTEDQQHPCHSHWDTSCPLAGFPKESGRSTSSHHAPGRCPPLITYYRPGKGGAIGESTAVFSAMTSFFEHNDTYIERAIASFQLYQDVLFCPRFVEAPRSSADQRKCDRMKMIRLGQSHGVSNRIAD